MLALLGLVIVCVIMGFTIKKRVSVTIFLFILNGYLAQRVGVFFELETSWMYLIGGISIICAFIISRFT